MSPLRPSTRIVQFNGAPGDPHAPIATPIYQTATFEQPAAAVAGRYDYGRSGNPTRTVLEELLAELEGAERALAFSSGMAAITAVTRLARSGEAIVAGDDLYGGTYRLLDRLATAHGVAVRYADTTDPEAVAAALDDDTRMVLLETPSNPLLKVTDVGAIARLAHARGALLVVDNSVMSPYLQQPLRLGADVVVASATKALSGHSDLTGGMVAVADASVAERLYWQQNAEGTALGPFDAWLLLRSIKTLAVRLDRQVASAARVADFLRGRPEVEAVRYPGLVDDPGHELHRRQARSGGMLLSFITDSELRSRRVVEATRLFKIAVSFGGVGSVISQPCRLSHASVPATVRRERPLPEALVRISVGVEDAEDLIDDLAAALAAADGEVGAAMG